VLLRNIPTKEVDTLVHQLNQEVSAAIDCTTCGNCCKQLEPPVDQEEINQLASVKGMDANSFETKYVGKEINTNIQFLKCQPCIFLQTTTCGIYEQRPTSCADYPHLHQPNFKFRWKSIMANYAICPIVFNVVEHLKEKLNYTKTEGQYV
jgi:Fe-S-cluster containining protein